jgi:hypothetical protein
MPNVTISIDEDLLQAGRRYAERNQMSFNGLVRQLLEDTVGSREGAWIDDCFELMDRAGADSKGRRWRREELYDE